MPENIRTHRHSGQTCDNHDGKPLIWNGHLCEGANLTAPIGRDFCLWTKCGKHDVPANAAHVGSHNEVTCAACHGKTPQSLAEMRAEVARDRGWHLDDDGDRIDAELNERFGQTAIELYEALKEAQSVLAILIDPESQGVAGISSMTAWAQCVEAEAKGRAALKRARGES